ncbi:MAG: glycoside hydrolase family 127 protein, partial [Chloroflexi bacterium]|nr:glycoside hydrolase family 127 protein [Chloroflexota bacterium]
MDELIDKFAAAQEDDGYLYTARTIDPDNVPEACGPKRWSNLAVNHELYNVGHMYEAAVAYFQATGKRSFLDIAIRNADLIDSVFGPEKLRDVPGHQEIEIGLVALYRITGDARYLRLARFFLDERGQENGRQVYGHYCQDHQPVTEQREAVGHAVRAGYMYAAMTDIAGLNENPDKAAAENGREGKEAGRRR